MSMLYPVPGDFADRYEFARTTSVANDFQAWEFYSGSSHNRREEGQAPPQSWAPRLFALAENLQTIRDEIGESPLRINSGWRSLSHNQAIGGAMYSHHLFLFAADLASGAVDAETLFDTIRALIESEEVAPGTLILYPEKHFVHYDMRGWSSFFRSEGGSITVVP